MTARRIPCSPEHTALRRAASADLRVRPFPSRAAMTSKPTTTAATSRHLVSVYDWKRGTSGVMSLDPKLLARITGLLDRQRWLDGLRPSLFATFPEGFCAHDGLQKLDLDDRHDIHAVAAWMRAQTWRAPVGLGVDTRHAPGAGGSRHYALFLDERDRMLVKLRW